MKPISQSVHTSVAGTSGPVVSRYTAFTDGGTGGNPAGVVLDASSLDDSERLALAAELGYSETAFVEAEPGAPARHYRVRYFSPEAEVAFCGHATIAAAVAMAERDESGELEFSTLAGPITVLTTTESDGITATLTSVPTHTRPVDPDALAQALATLHWSAAELDPRYPAHVAFAGNDHLILAVRDRDTLAALDYDYLVLKTLMVAQDWTTLHLVWAASPTEFHARDPFPPGGVVEDPATGAAAAAFGGYLRSLDLVQLPAQVTIHQGTELGRPSLLLVDIVSSDDRVRVTGSASELR